MNWYRIVTNNLEKIPDCVSYYENELLDAKKELGVKNKPLERLEAELPGIVEHRFNQLQTLEAILEYLNIQLKKEKVGHFKKYLMHYQRKLSSREAEKFAEAEDSVVQLSLLINEIALIRNQYLGVIKGLEHKGFMLGHITKLRVAGLDDAMLQ